ncbi:MAG: branched-chain amino acid ABC transporter permease [Coriobacteriia bacterium]|nr:branched-chain amino acid ABC transporter permease [Coriobacteriia bacterium]MBS5478523.1 branched-chain amino acid ABC transporter permease [Coriobacteriia bacterium]
MARSLILPGAGSARPQASRTIKANYLINAIAVVAMFFALVGFDQSGAMTSYVKGIVVVSCIAVIMTTSLNLTLGLLGQLTLGCCSFQMIGAYTAALLSKLMVANGVLVDAEIARFLLVTLAAGLMALLFGILVGIPALRLRGDYLAIITLGFGEIVRVVLQNLKFAGGQGLDQGQAGQALVGIDRLADNHLYIVFWIMVATVAFLFLFARSRFGRAVKSIREDEIAAGASGINVTFYKVLTFGISAFFAGIAGSIFAQHLGTLQPANAGWLQSVNYVIMVVFGGMGSMTGSVLAAVGLTLLPEALRAFADYRMLVYSVALVLVMIFRPQGIFGSWEFSLSRLLRRIFGGQGGSGQSQGGHAVLSASFVDPKGVEPAPISDIGAAGANPDIAGGDDISHSPHGRPPVKRGGITTSVGGLGRRMASGEVRA